MKTDESECDWKEKMKNRERKDGTDEFVNATGRDEEEDR
jgi:hypothetical protein